MEQYGKNSPYSKTPQTSWYLEHMEQISFYPDGSDTFITVDPQYEHRPDRLASDLYGSSELWWVFAMRNPDLIKDPIYDLVPGMTIWVPSATRVSSVVR